MSSAEAPQDVGPGWLGGVLAVAGLAFRESARNRVLHALLGAMLLLTGIAHTVAWVSGDDPVRRLKVVADLVLASIGILGTIASVFLGTSLIYQEVERRTIYTVLARPLDRGGLVLGKFLGLLAIVGLAVLAMSAVGLLGCAAAHPGGALERLDKLLLAIAFTYVELAVVISVALFFSVAAHPVEGAVFAFVVTGAGHMTSSLRDLAAQVVGSASPHPPLATRVVAGVLEVGYVLLPNMEQFDVRSQAVHDLHIDPVGLAGSLVYGVVYAAIVLAVATAVFRRRVL